MAKYLALLRKGWLPFLFLAGTMIAVRQANPAEIVTPIVFSMMALWWSAVIVMGWYRETTKLSVAKAKLALENDPLKSVKELESLCLVEGKVDAVRGLQAREISKVLTEMVTNLAGERDAVVARCKKLAWISHSVLV